MVKSISFSGILSSGTLFLDRYILKKRNQARITSGAHEYHALLCPPHVILVFSHAWMPPGWVYWNNQTVKNCSGYWIAYTYGQYSIVAIWLNIKFVMKIQMQDCLSHKVWCQEHVELLSPLLYSHMLSKSILGGFKIDCVRWGLETEPNQTLSQTFWFCSIFDNWAHCNPVSSVEFV